MPDFIITLKRYSEVTSQAIGPFTEEVATEKAKEIRATKKFVRVHILPITQDLNESAHN